MSYHDEKRVAAGLKAAISNPNVSEEAKERAQHRLDDMGTSDPSENESNRVLGGYKATLHNPNSSPQAKQHAREVLTEADARTVSFAEEVDVAVLPDLGLGAGDVDEHQRRINAGHKAALHNPNVGPEAKAHARQYLEVRDELP